ncbi:MAG: ornithine carbamoyltransferase [Acidimicrobiales bacterium]
MVGEAGTGRVTGSAGSVPTTSARRSAHHVLEVDDLGREGLARVMGLAERDPKSLGEPLAGKGVALLFEKPSNRTRNSSEMATVALGGHPVYIQGHEVGLGTRESAEDVARTLACYHSVLCARVSDHRSLLAMAAALDDAGIGVPVVNLLSDRAHPCQALADLLTLREIFGADSLQSRTLAYVGDANNVWRSLAVVAAMSGIATRVASPAGYGPSSSDLELVRRLGGDVMVTDDATEAVAGADVLYTDVWTSMGDEDDSERRRAAFSGYTVDEDLVARASRDAVVLHCLPAHRGEEITAGVVDGPRSVVWRQAANRLPAMRGLLAFVGGSGAHPGVASSRPEKRHP